MNNHSPFLPQSSPTEKNQARARVKIGVFFVLAVNGIGLMALLMQGCRQEKPATEAEVATNQAPPDAVATTDSNTPAATATNTATPVVETPAPTPPLAPPTATESEYTIAQGDTLGAIATKNHVKVSAIEAANPGIEPTKLKIGQKIHIPAPTPTLMATAAGTGADSANGEHVYTVKSGDTLGKIAKNHETSIKALRALNPSVATTDRIKVGDKLKLPAKSSGAVATALAPVDSTGASTAATTPVSNPLPSAAR